LAGDFEALAGDFEGLAGDLEAFAGDFAGVDLAGDSGDFEGVVAEGVGGFGVGGLADGVVAFGGVAFLGVPFAFFTPGPVATIVSRNSTGLSKPTQEDYEYIYAKRASGEISRL
jgi:hypothetical protein